MDTTLLATQLKKEENWQEKLHDGLKVSLEFLLHNEVLYMKDEQERIKYEISHFGKAIFKTQFSPEEGILIFRDMQAANRELILEEDLHLLYLLTPVSFWFKIDWNRFH